MSRKKPTVCILYGLCEGRHIGRNFEQALRVSGFELSQEARQADIIVAHSGGCFLLPTSYQAKLVLLIGLPYWPGKSKRKILLRKTWLDMHLYHHEHMHLAWFRKAYWNLIYFWNMPRNWRMLRGLKLETHKLAKNAVLIRNREDQGCIPDAQLLHFEHETPLLSLPGQHDDCWLRPKTYLAIIRAYYGQ